MTRVEINSGDRHVIIDSPDADPTELSDTALQLWKQAEPTRTGRPGSAGFSMERASQWDHDRRSPVRAEDAG